MHVSSCIPNSLFISSMLELSCLIAPEKETFVLLIDNPMRTTHVPLHCLQRSVHNTWTSCKQGQQEDRLPTETQSKPCFCVMSLQKFE